MRRWIVPVFVLAGAATAAIAYRGALVDWFRPGRVPAAAAPASSAPAAPPVLTDAALQTARRALAAQEEARALLAADKVDGLAAHARAIADAMRATRTAVSTAPAPLVHALEEGATAAERLAAAPELGAARVAFGDVSRALVAVAEAEPRLREGWHLFECPMSPGYQKWLQRGASIENPYMGPKMLTCGGASEWAAADHAHADGEIAFYTCPMHPSVQQSGPGKCPICGMDLTPVTRGETEGGLVLIDPVRRQEIGVRTAPVARGPIRREIRAAGRVTWDERTLRDVTLKLQGWIRDLDVNATGQVVRKGQRMFTVYSPELYAAQQEYLLALRTREAGGERMDGLVQAAEVRLRLWDLSAAQIRDLAQRGAPLEAVPFLAPAGGVVIQKDVVAGAAVMPGQRLYRIAALDRVWVEADVYEADLGDVRVGQPARVSLAHLDGATFDGKVAYVYPELDATTRTARVRVELPNPAGTLKPAMYATVNLAVDHGERLRIPESAVLYTGERRLVFVDLGEGRLRPQEVRLGAKADGWYEVRDGLEEGQVIVTSGNFLVAAESRIRAAATYWSENDHGGH